MKHEDFNWRAQYIVNSENFALLLRFRPRAAGFAPSVLNALLVAAPNDSGSFQRSLSINKFSDPLYFRIISSASGSTLMEYGLCVFARR
ncbi:hypothetical protein [uncultured Duncaniella sp.]|uniref:hypothetical protein n=1 Tax=uncultured Duncaniella sp. TaxID=2768039 RepID=UPI0027371678|nr:hypothetical protein [uncultured Duncaniella sp.]